MSEFFDAGVRNCPYCGTPYATCEGMNCECMELRDQKSRNYEKEETTHAPDTE